MVAVPTMLVEKDGKKMRVNTHEQGKWAAQGWSAAGGAKDPVGSAPSKIVTKPDAPKKAGEK